MKEGAGTLRASRSASLRPAWIAVSLLVAVIVGLGVGFGVHRLAAGTAATPANVTTRFGMHGEAAWAARTRPAPVIDTLRDQTGHLFSLAALRGRSVAIVFFDLTARKSVAMPLEIVSGARDVMARTSDEI